MNKSELKRETPYFLLHYLDEDLLVPEIRTYFFLGVNLLSDGNADEFYFQGAEAYLTLGEWEKSRVTSDYDLLLIKQDCLDDIHNNQSLRERLECIDNERDGYFSQ